ncbi:MAG: HAMP domain-containing protein [Terriglobia bacterium]
MIKSLNLGHGGLPRLSWHGRKEPLRVFAPGTSLRRRVAYSLAIVRLILVPVILLAVFYLFEMSRIVDRIVRVDAQVATLAESVSIQMLNARRMELNYFLFHDPHDLQSSHQALDQMQKTLARCKQLQPADAPAIRQIQQHINIYRQQFNDAVSHMSSRHQTANQHFQDLVRAYEQNLDVLLKRSQRVSRAHLLDALRSQNGLFDNQVAALAAEDPVLRKATQALQVSSKQILNLSSDLESSSWNRVRQDHDDAGHLMWQAEWVLSIVSALVVILSILVSIILPRQIIRPLMDLKEAMDHAAAGNYEIEFDVQGKGEVAQLATSVRKLIAHVSEKKEESGVNRSG